MLVDVAVAEAGKRLSVPEQARAALVRAEKTLKAKPDDLSALNARALARLRLGDNGKALDDLNAVLAKSKDDLNALELRAIAQARLGKKDPARADLARYQKDAPERSRLALAAIVAAELGDGTDAAIAALEAALRKEPGDADLRYDAARAFAVASKAVDRADHAKARALAGRALALLQEGARDNDLSFALLDDSWYFDPLRDDPAFARLLDAGHPERRFAGVWSTEARFEAASLDALDPAEHLRRGRELASQGYRPCRMVGRPHVARGPAAVGLGLAPAAGRVRGQGPAGRAPGAGGGGPGAPGSGGVGLAPPAAQPRPTAAELHRQLAQPAGRRPARGRCRA